MPVPFVGQIVMAGNETPPADLLLCDGRAVSRSDYSDLFAAIGERFGAGDGSFTFNLPNLSKRFPVGYDATGADATYEMADTGGASSSAVAAHDHTGTTGSRTQNTTGATAGGVSVVTDIGGSASHNHTITSQGSVNVPTVPPYTALAFFIVYRVPPAADVVK